jgi:hypothetical protein
MRHRHIALGLFPVAEHSEQRDVALSIPLQREQRDGDSADGLRSTNPNDIDQLPRLRWRWWRGGMVCRSGVVSERVLPAR